MKDFFEIFCLLVIFMNSTMQLMLILYIFKELRLRKILRAKEVSNIEKECERIIDARVLSIHDEVIEKVRKNVKETLEKEFVEKEVEDRRELIRYMEEYKRNVEKVNSESLSKEIRREVMKNNKLPQRDAVSRESKMVASYSNREMDSYLNLLNQSIEFAEYGKYIENGWMDVGTGDGRNMLAEGGKIKYGKGNVKIREININSEKYMAIPGKTQWTGQELCSDAMKECFLIGNILAEARYKIVRIQRLGILQRVGEKFTVKQRGIVEVSKIEN